MRTATLRFSILVVVCALIAGHAAAQSSYYLALGDSLAIGIQPSANGDVPTNQGYADDLYKVYRTRIPGLALAKLGCSGETTNSMIHGGICNYSAGSQLAAAVAFIETHPVRLITLDIGGNDIDHCISTSGIDATCVVTALASVGSDLPQILAALRSAAGPYTRIVGMNYYDPFLAAWTLGAAGQALAKASVQATDGFNSVLQGAYQAFSVPVANVAHAYQTNNFSVIPFINLPVNVFLSLSWTWMGAPPPLGPDIHANAVGYLVIAGAFAEKIGAP
jgi:lysophospholipase L1-like esterase